MFWTKSYLILVEVLVDEFVLALLLESDDDQGYEDVDEEEGEHDEVDDVEYGHLHAVVRGGTLVFKRRVHGMLEHTGTTRKQNISRRLPDSARNTWRRDLQADIGKTWQQLEKVVQDRGLWRTVVDVPCPSREQRV